MRRTHKTRQTPSETRAYNVAQRQGTHGTRAMRRACAFASWALITALVTALAGCGGEGGTRAGEQTSVINQDEYTVSYEYDNVDSDNLWGENATVVEFNSNTVRVSGLGATFSNGRLTISQAGTYVLSGTLTNGQILIDVDKNDTVRLVLNGVSLHNEGGPAIFSPKAEKVVLILEKDTVNFVSDGSNYANDDKDAAIYIQNDLSITGEGTLTVAGNHLHGIRAQDYLVITDGVINVTAKGDALRGRDGVAISGGSFNLTAGSDGIYSNNDSDDTKGFISISGGEFIINAQNDGIQAESSLTITGGLFQITTGGGSANAPVRGNGLGGGQGGGFGGGSSTSRSATATESMKALKARKLVYITGGDFVIDAYEDGIHCDGDIKITGGAIEIKAGDDGIHADHAVEIYDGTINISYSYEGIEGLTVTIHGGVISIYSTDDGINASNGEGTAPGGGRPGASINQNVLIRITGGVIDIHSQGDGIDSNGHMYIEGGLITVSAPSQVMEGALDSDGDTVVTGGQIITAGSWESVSSKSTQPSILLSYTSQLSAGTLIEIKDSKGNTLLEYTSKVSFSMSGFTSPEFKIGEIYTLYINGAKRIDITLTGLVTSLSDTGGTYSGNGGFGGGAPGGGAPGGQRR